MTIDRALTDGGHFNLTGGNVTKEGTQFRKL